MPGTWRWSPSGDAVIAVGGAWGTLSEIAFARVLGRPVVVLEPGWAVAGEGVERASTPEEAVDLALRLAGTAVDGKSH
jgi:predicted Rossmann-fold nucleotide-binding protein